ncbi:hypothetical protein [Microbacterium sp. Bi98]|uniref:hypothetical protein n=1 Tax=Microbacterium sp. Bi98 TaxID=2821116 RepID=UPI001E36D6F7|nr:hypothetical protein [Microbacterium sp. Bi98]
MGNQKLPAGSLWFSEIPIGFKSFAKEFMYVLINDGYPEEYRDQPYGPRSKWPSPGSLIGILDRVLKVTRFFVEEWSATHPQTPVSSPRDLDADHLEDLRVWVEQSGWTAKTQVDLLRMARSAWHLAPFLADENRWPEPRWLRKKTARRVEENQTARIRQEVMSPLITWACAFVEDFAEDIFSAREHYLQRTESTRPFEQTSLEDCLRILDQYEGHCLPGRDAYNAPGTKQASWHVFEYHHGVSRSRMAQALSRHRDRHKFGFSRELDLARLDFRPSAVFYGAPWMDGFHVLDLVPGNARGTRNQFNPLLSHLFTACIIVVTYLTGARPREVLSLEFGAGVPPIQRADGGSLHLISGHTSKGITLDDDGNAVPPRPVKWATVPSGWRAIQVAERIRRLFGESDGLLFTTSGSRHGPSLITSWIDSFIAFVNERIVADRDHLQGFRIPADPDGDITLRRFRRTLSWFLANQPGGDITLAIQYQHLRTAMGSGYAGTQRGHLNDLLLEDDWAHRRETIEQLGTMLHTGEGIYGLSADRAVRAVSKLPPVTTPAEERRLRRDPELVLYDNPGAIAICAFKAETAKCVNEDPKPAPRRPNLPGCQELCPNLARTGSHLLQITDQAEGFRAAAAISPLPIAQSLSAHAEELELLVEETRARPALTLENSHE